nr:hypothetical protein [uncultured Desulfobulbus sp.]
MMACVAICGLITAGTPSRVWAVEQTAETAAAARKLQLEGTRLQLQGNLEEAVKKYRESAALQPNPKLDGLIKQLEPKIGKKGAAEEPAPQAAAQDQTEPTVAPAPVAGEQGGVVDPQPGEQPATQGEAATPASEPAQPAVAPVIDAQPAPPAAEPPPVVVQRPPGTPQEELIYAFTDWFIALFPASQPGTEFALQTNRNYAITPVDGEYEVRLDPFILTIDKTDSMALGPVIFRFQPQDANLLSVHMQIAEKAPIMSHGKPEAELTIGRQQLSGLWNRNLMNFDKLNLRLADLAIEDALKTGRLSLGELVVAGGRSEEQGGGWIEKFQGELKQLAFVEKNTNFGVESLSGQVVATGTNAKRFLELRARLQHGFNRIDEMQVADLKPMMTDLDEYMQLFNGYASSASLHNLHLSSRDGVAALAAVSLSGGVHKEANTGKFVYNSEGTFNDFTFTEQESKRTPTPVAITLHKIGVKSDGGMLALPPHLFAEIYAAIEGYQQVKNEEADNYAARQGFAFAQKILALIERYSGEITINDVLVVNAQPAPVTLERATVAAGFDVGDGQGGKIHTMMDFSGLQGIMPGSNTVPQAGRIRLELSRIPSLLHLINDPTPLASGNMDAIQGQIMMNGMGALMQSGVTLAMQDSFVNFPAAKATLALLAQVEPNAKYLSSGTLNLTMENPEELKRIIQSYSQNPETGKMLAALTALADRRQEGDKMIDRIDAKIDAEGKVFINQKDVTSMFFPPPPAPSQGAAQPPAK